LRQEPAAIDTGLHVLGDPGTWQRHAVIGRGRLDRSRRFCFCEFTDPPVSFTTVKLTHRTRRRRTGADGSSAERAYAAIIYYFPFSPQAGQSCRL
jgi:hypothetical protein